MGTIVTVSDKDDRKVYIDIKDMGNFKAPQNIELSSLHGEDLVKVILESNKGNVASVERYKDGLRSDGPNGEEHSQHFNNAGTKIMATRYKNDKQNDGSNGEPAAQFFNDSGTLIHAESFKDNVSQGTVVYNESAVKAKQATAVVLGQLGISADVSALPTAQDRAYKGGPKR